jgi:hypothetical protein
LVEAFEAHEHIGDPLDQHRVVGIIPRRCHLYRRKDLQVLSWRKAQREVTGKVVRLIGRHEEVADDEELGVERETKCALGTGGCIDDANATRRSTKAILNFGETSFPLAHVGRGVDLGVHRCDACPCNDAP